MTSYSVYPSDTTLPTTCLGDGCDRPAAVELPEPGEAYCWRCAALRGIGPRDVWPWPRRLGQRPLADCDDCRDAEATQVWLDSEGYTRHVCDRCASKLERGY